MQGAFLIVDDDRDVLKAAAMVLSDHAGRIGSLPSPERLIAEAPHYEAVLLDMNFVTGIRNGAEGLILLDRLVATDPTLSVVLMTTYGSVGVAVEALKRGAVDFLLKPWRNETLISVMREAAALTLRKRKGVAGIPLAELEKQAVLRAVAENEGNITRAAYALGLTRPALYRKLNRYGR